MHMDGANSMVLSSLRFCLLVPPNPKSGASVAQLKYKQKIHFDLTKFFKSVVHIFYLFTQ